MKINIAETLGTENYERKTEPDSTSPATFWATYSESKKFFDGIRHYEEGETYIHGEPVCFCFGQTHIEFVSGNKRNPKLAALIPYSLPVPPRDIKKTLKAPQPTRSLGDFSRFFNVTFSGQNVPTVNISEKSTHLTKRE